MSEQTLTYDFAACEVVIPSIIGDMRVPFADVVNAENADRTAVAVRNIWNANAETSPKTHAALMVKVGTAMRKARAEQTLANAYRKASKRDALDPSDHADASLLFSEVAVMAAKLRSLATLAGIKSLPLDADGGTYVIR